MVGIGMGLIFAGYAVGIWGYCLVRGYDVSFANVFGMTWPGPSVTPPTGGHKLGTITGPGIETSNPGQQTVT